MATGVNISSVGGTQCTWHSLSVHARPEERGLGFVVTAGVAEEVLAPQSLLIQTVCPRGTLIGGSEGARHEST
jgi:hypothetical protein